MNFVIFLCIILILFSLNSVSLLTPNPGDATEEGQPTILFPNTHDTHSRNRRRIHVAQLFYFKPETGVYATELMIYHRLLFIFVISCKWGVNSLVVIYLFTIIHRLRRFQPCLFSAPEIFIPDVYGTKNRHRKHRRQKMESICAADFWSMCHEIWQYCSTSKYASLTESDFWCNV